MKRIHSYLALCALLSLPVLAHGADPAGTQTRSRQHVHDQQLVTPEERTIHQDRMQNSATQAERATVRQEHLDLLKARAKEQGLPAPQAGQGRMGASPQGGVTAPGGGKAGAGGRGGAMGRGR